MAAHHRDQINAAHSSRLGCSLDLDNSLAREYPNASRWDYLVVVESRSARCVGVEVHSATAGEVRVIVAKRDWARGILRQRCEGGLPASADWYWIASGKVFLRATDPQFRVLRRSGIQGPSRGIVLE